MDLGKANPRTIATLIVNGKRQLSEVPQSNRDAVASCVKDLRKDLKRREYEGLKWPKLQKLYKELSGGVAKTASAMIAELIEL